ncbi:MAG: epoxyqueuosine reductase QueH [Kiritimatiellae bacterium]|nr:epoxyqueuosine reductase QueH [Kiritimatiellia bacterium]
MTVLLHTCCAPCATHCIEVLCALGHTPTLFFSNANIAPESEFYRRAQEVTKLANIANLPLIIDNPDHSEWLARVAAGLESEPEQGARCARCFQYALQRSHRQMRASGLDAFTTTLTVSPHKLSDLIARIGREISESEYLNLNFKKQGGFMRSLELSEEHDLYRQHYCGCEFSMRPLAD